MGPPKRMGSSAAKTAVLTDWRAAGLGTEAMHAGGAGMRRVRLQLSGDKGRLVFHRLLHIAQLVVRVGAMEDVLAAKWRSPSVWAADWGACNLQASM